MICHALRHTNSKSMHDERDSNAMGLFNGTLLSYRMHINLVISLNSSQIVLIFPVVRHRHIVINCSMAVIAYTGCTVYAIEIAKGTDRICKYLNIKHFPDACTETARDCKIRLEWIPSRLLFGYASTHGSREWACSLYVFEEGLIQLEKLLYMCLRRVSSN